jgi:hypothetical protein
MKFIDKELKRLLYVFQKKRLQKRYFDSLRSVRRGDMVDFPCNRAWRRHIEDYHASINDSFSREN